MNVNTYFTSDWHVGHANIIKFSNRPFRDVDHMHRVLVNNYNASVRINDVCYFLGDMGMHQGEAIKEIMKQLNGTKILIMGNHDKKGRQFWYECGFSAVMYSSSLRIAKNTVTMTHCPLYGVWRENTLGMRGIDPDNPPNWHGEEKQYQNGFAIKDDGQFHLHGHIHSPNSGKSVKILDRQYDVGVDANNYRPVSMSTIESWIAKYGREDA